MKLGQQTKLSTNIHMLVQACSGNVGVRTSSVDILVGQIGAVLLLCSIFTEIRPRVSILKMS
jgi:hypothetical protein